MGGKESKHSDSAGSRQQRRHAAVDAASAGGGDPSRVVHVASLDQVLGPQQGTAQGGGQRGVKGPTPAAVNTAATSTTPSSAGHQAPTSSSAAARGAPPAVAVAVAARSSTAAAASPSPPLARKEPAPLKFYRSTRWPLHFVEEAVRDRKIAPDESGANDDPTPQSPVTAQPRGLVGCSVLVTLAPADPALPRSTSQDWGAEECTLCMLFFTQGLNRCRVCHEGCCSRCLLDLLPPPQMTAVGSQASTHGSVGHRAAAVGKECPFCAATPYRYEFTGRLSRDAWQTRQREAKKVAQEERDILERAMQDETRRVEKAKSMPPSAGPSPVTSFRDGSTAAPKPPAARTAAEVEAMELDNELAVAAQLSLDGPDAAGRRGAWSCPACGWLNYGTTSCCRPRDAVVGAIPGPQLNGTTTGHTGACSFHRGAWACGACSYENQASATACAMCGTPAAAASVA